MLLEIVRSGFQRKDRPDTPGRGTSSFKIWDIIENWAEICPRSPHCQTALKFGVPDFGVNLIA
jgi:hypothetical protein